MTGKQIELYNRRSEIKSQIRELENKLHGLNNEILETFHFQVGDKVRFKTMEGWPTEEVVEKEAWIIKKQLNDYKDGYVTLTVHYSRQDGSRSLRRRIVHGIDSDTIEVIEKAETDEKISD